MLSDIEIAQGCQMRPITEVAAAAGLDADDLELYGKYKAKLSADVWTKVKDKENGKLVLVTAINPTPAGEGKTTTSVGLGQALCKQGKNAIIALREPSLGPVFGIKGGAAGGGYAQVVPMEDINLHFTGDMHAITAANNLLCAMLDNHMQQGKLRNIDPRRIARSAGPARPAARPESCGWFLRSFLPLVAPYGDDPAVLQVAFVLVHGRAIPAG